MNAVERRDWAQANQQYLLRALERLRLLLHQQLEPSADPVFPPPPSAPAGPPPALLLLQERFGLSSFETDLLLLCAGVDLDAAVAGMVAQLRGVQSAVAPTLSLALRVLPHPHWDALTPTANLRYWRLIEPGPGETLTASPLRIDERILHFLAGVSHLDERMRAALLPLPAPPPLPPSQQQLACRIAAAWQPPDQPLPALLLEGADYHSRRQLAAAACAELDLALYRLLPAALPAEAGSLDAFLRLCERELLLDNGALLLDADDLGGDEQQAARLTQLIERLDAPLLLSGFARGRQVQRPLLHFTVQRPGADEQQRAWQQALAPLDPTPELIERLAGQFSLDLRSIETVAAEAAAECAAMPAADLADVVWQACRAQARPQLDQLIQRIEARAGWDDLVLPPAQQRLLSSIAAHVRMRYTVYERWGFGGRDSRGLGISALFAGVSGTGKTTAAEVLAGALQLDLYRIDLSAVVSKYIGETEKNLRQVFDAAEAGGAILLFDEADALFGKRSEVKDSHDRYANIEVSYLLQRMESYRGLAILTTNLKSALDPAFLRRLRFVVQFPFPDFAQREQIWRRIFPPGVPLGALDYAKLARLNITGGNIRNIALNAAFLAADESRAVGMAQLLQATRSEYAKLERSLTDAEIAGWLTGD